MTSRLTRAISTRAPIEVRRRASDCLRQAGPAVLHETVNVLLYGRRPAWIVHAITGGRGALSEERLRRHAREQAASRLGLVALAEFFDGQRRRQAREELDAA